MNMKFGNIYIGIVCAVSLSACKAIRWITMNIPIMTIRMFFLDFRRTAGFVNNIYLILTPIFEDKFIGFCL